MTSEGSGRAAPPREGPALLCHDGSEHADGAVREAARLLRPRRAIVVGVAHRPFAGDVGEAGREAARRAGFDTVEVLRVGHAPAPGTVLEQARARGASVIVVAAPGRSAPFGGLAGALVERSDLPVLVAHAAAPPAIEPIFVCYDGSPAAREAVAAAPALLAGRAAVVAAFVPAVDDGAVLRTSLPWPAPGETLDRLARTDLAEAAAPAERAAEGARLAAAAGFVARPVGIAGADASSGDDQEPWRLLLQAAAREQAACVVMGHRHSARGAASTAHALLRHADRPVLVVPAA